MVWGEVVEADLWRSGGNGRAGETWGLCGACQRSERAVGSALIGNCHPRAKMGRLAALWVFHREPSRSSRFHNRQRWQAAEAARFAFSRLWCLGGLMWILAHFVRTSGARFVMKNFPLRSKNGAPSLSHLLHHINQVTNLSDS